jgi:hypothetical protein
VELLEQCRGITQNAKAWGFNLHSIGLQMLPQTPNDASIEKLVLRLKQGVIRNSVVIGCVTATVGKRFLAYAKVHDLSPNAIGEKSNPNRHPTSLILTVTPHVILTLALTLRFIFIECRCQRQY